MAPVPLRGGTEGGRDAASAAAPVPCCCWGSRGSARDRGAGLTALAEAGLCPCQRTAQQLLPLHKRSVVAQAGQRRASGSGQAQSRPGLCREVEVSWVRPSSGAPALLGAGLLPAETAVPLPVPPSPPRRNHRQQHPAAGLVSPPRQGPRSPDSVPTGRRHDPRAGAIPGVSFAVTNPICLSCGEKEKKQLSLYSVFLYIYIYLYIYKNITNIWGSDFSPNIFLNVSFFSIYKYLYSWNINI